MDSNREPRVLITLTSLLNCNKLLFFFFWWGDGGQPHFPFILPNYLYTQNTLKEMDGNREPIVSITLTLLFGRERNLFWGERWGDPFTPPLSLTCWHVSYQELPWSICWATEYPNMSPLFPLCVKGVFISKLKADTGWWWKHRRRKQRARVTAVGLILNLNILLSLKHPEHFERIRESITVEESIVLGTRKLFFSFL